MLVSHATVGVISPPLSSPPINTIQEQKAADMRKAWAVITAATYALLPWCKEGPAAVSTTVLSLLHANALPPRVKKASLCMSPAQKPSKCQWWLARCLSHAGSV